MGAERQNHLTFVNIFKYHFSLQPNIAMEEFLTDIGTLLTDNVEFNGNDDFETLTEEYGNKVAAVTKAAVEYGTLTGGNETSAKSGKALIKLAGSLGKAFPHLTDEEIENFKTIVDEVSDSADPAVDLAGRNLFNTAVDGVRAAQKMSDSYNTAQTGGA